MFNLATCIYDIIVVLLNDFYANSSNKLNKSKVISSVPLLVGLPRFISQQKTWGCLNVN